MPNNLLARYELAQTLSQGKRSTRLVRNDAVFPHWVSDTCFWYIRDTRDGREFRLVDADAHSNVPAFDHGALADALTRTAGKPVDPANLPISGITLDVSVPRLSFQAMGKHWSYEPESQQLSEDPAIAEEGLRSPDGKHEAYVQDHNLLIRDLATGQETALTQDGTADAAYAAKVSMVAARQKPQAVWSPDSKYLFTLRSDSRDVPPTTSIVYVPQDGSLRPKVSSAKFSSNDQLLIIDVRSGEVQPVDYPPLPFHMIGDMTQYGFFGGKEWGWWSPDSGSAFFVDLARDLKTVRVVTLNPQTGATRVLFEEVSETFLNLSHSPVELPHFLPLPESDELIWSSERSGSTHLYLYDLKSGKEKNTITKGGWLVRDVVHYDAQRRELVLQTGGRDSDVSPYYRDVCRVNIDSGELTSLASGPFEHIVYHSGSFAVMARGVLGIDSPGIHGVSPGARYVVTTRSRVDTVPVSVLVNDQGKEILTLETADVSNLPSGWQWPEPVKLKAADGHTDIYGTVFRPPDFSEDAQYPIVHYSCSQRAMSMLPQGSFVNTPLGGAHYLPPAALAALGFVVVMLDGRGGPLRSKAFQDYRYGDQASTCDVGDCAAGFRELAERYPYLDLTRIGITGDETCINSVHALLHHPDTYKVAVVHCFLDPRFRDSPDGVCDKTAPTRPRHAEDHVATLTGKLLLIQGMFAEVAGMFRLVEALQKANKDFDMLCMPNMMHQTSSYTTRREWDYFVRHLQGIEPPKEFRLTTGTDLANQEAAKSGYLDDVEGQADA